MDAAGDGELVHLLVSIGKQGATLLSLIIIHVMSAMSLMKYN